MPRIPIAIAQGFYVDESLPISSQRCVNFRPHIPQTKTITSASLIGTDGISLAVELNYSLVVYDDLFYYDELIDYDFNNTPAESNRGGWNMAGIAYEVNGPLLYKVTYTEDSFGVRTYSSTDVSGSELINGTGRVIMRDNGTQLCIVAPDYTGTFNAWIYTVAGGLVQVSDVDFNGPVNSMCFLDGYFLFSKANSNIFFKSQIRDGLAYDALDFASAESDPDNIVALAPLNGLLYVFGSKTFEQWQDVGGAGFPFAKVSSGSQQKGCAAAFSLTEFNGTLVWIGGGEKDKPSVWMTNGGEVKEISTPAVNVLLNSGGATALSSAFNLSWGEKGDKFVAFTVPDICTIEYNSANGIWSERESIDDLGNTTPWRVSSLISAYSVFLVGDLTSGKIGILNDTVFTEYGNRISSYFTVPSFDNNGEPFTVNSVELMMETGVVPLTGDGSNPVVRMAVSTDGGRTYSPEIYRLMGTTASYEQRVAWDLLGRYSRSFTAKFICDEPIKKVIVKGEMSIAA